MGNRYLLIISLMIAAIGGCIYRLNIVTVVLLGITITVFCLNFNKQSAYLFIVLAIPFLCYFAYDASRLAQQSSQKDNDSASVCGVILPDEIIINGDRLQANAHLVSGETVRLYTKLTSQLEKQTWSSENRIMHFQGIGDFARIKPPTNFNQFDAKSYYETKHVTHQIIIKSWTVQQAKKASLWQKCRYQLHIWHAKGIHNTETLPQPLSDYAQALILGTTPQSLYGNNPGVQTLGLIHLFSVSGFHVSYVLMLLMGILRRLYVPKEISALIGSVVLLLYFVFAGEPAVLLRALIAGLIMMTRLAGCRRVPSGSVWAVSLLGSLIYEPGILLSLGGQLSFALTFCLIFVKKLNFWQINLLLSAVSLPLIVSQQYTWHILQTVTNFAAIPLFSAVIVPCVMIGFFGQLLPIVMHLMNAVIKLFAQTVDAIANLPGQIVVGHIPWFFVILLFMLSLILFVRQKRIAQFARIGWLVLLTLTMIWTHLPLHGEITTFDIGQGDSALIREPFNRTVTLIDTGGKLTFGDQQPWQVQSFQRTSGETVIINYLHSRGINHIDTLVLTHHDYDHIGDAKVILQKMKVTRLVMPAGMANQPAFEREIKPYLRKTVIFEVTQGTSVPDLPLQVLHPFQTGQAGNEDSVALYGQFGGQTMFTSGDLDQSGEAAIAAQYPMMKVDILKLGHHGSKTSTHPDVIKQWQPHVGIVSAGRNNRYHHPHAETLKTIQDSHMTLFNTQTHGMIRYIYTKQKGHFEVKLAHEPAATTTAN